MIPLVKSGLPKREVLMPALEKVLYSGYIAQGDVVDEFEQNFSIYIGNSFSVSVNSGSSALHIALILAGIKPGDEVISTPLTAEPTNTVILQTGAKIVWADIDYATGNISPEDVINKITSKTKAIMVVDYAGVPVNIMALQNIEKKYGIPVIQDSAHALGAKFQGSKLGTHFSYTTFSFQAIKHMTTIDGGMLCLKDEEKYERAKLIRWFGLDKKKTRQDNDIYVQGYKYHMNNVNAQIGILQLNRIHELVDPFIENGRYYDRELISVAGLELLEYYPSSEPSYWLYTLKVENRDKFIAKLTSCGIAASELHKRNDVHSIFSDSKTSLPNVDKFVKKHVHIPCGWWLSKNERELIVNCIKSGW